MTDEKDLDFWTDYYVKNPHMLRDFIKTANEQANRMAKELGENEAEIERLREALTTALVHVAFVNGKVETNNWPAMAYALETEQQIRDALSR